MFEEIVHSKQILWNIYKKLILSSQSRICPATRLSESQHPNSREKQEGLLSAAPIWNICDHAGPQNLGETPQIPALCVCVQCTNRQQSLSGTQNVCWEGLSTSSMCTRQSSAVCLAVTKVPWRKKKKKRH